MSDIPPVPCPMCGESQNSFAGEYAEDSANRVVVSCMVCGHVFAQEEFAALVEQVKWTPTAPFQG